MVRFTPTDERLHSRVKDCLQGLAALLSPTTELYVAAEVHVSRLLAQLDDPYPSARIGLLGHKQSGKSALINAVAVADVLPPDTQRMIAVSPKAVSAAAAATIGIGAAASKQQQQPSSTADAAASPPANPSAAVPSSSSSPFSGNTSPKMGSPNMVKPKGGFPTAAAIASELEPLLFRKSTGRAIAKGVANCRDHLIGEADYFPEALADRKMALPTLPLLDPTLVHCATVEYIDCPADACVFLPQLFQAASDVRLPNALTADCFWNCIDARVLARLINVLLPHLSSDAIGIEDEGLRRAAEEAVAAAGANEATVELAKRAAHDMLLYHIFSRCNAEASTPAHSRKCAVGATIFIITHSDAVMAGRDRNYEAEVRQRLLEGFAELARLVSGGEIDIDLDANDDEGVNERVIFFSAPSVFTTLKLLGQERPSIQEIYDYCEPNMGLGFMRTIDSIEEEALRRIVARYAADEIYHRSGAAAIVKRMKLADFNSAKIWLRGICLGGVECLEQLALAGASAQPALARQLAEAQSQLTELLRELEWAVAAAQRIKNYCVKTMIAAQVQFANRELDNFLQNCLEDVRYVLEHRELEWYRERHACTVVEMNASLKKLEAFTDSYMVRRAFLERKMQIRDDPYSAGNNGSGGGNGFGNSYGHGGFNGSMGAEGMGGMGGRRGSDDRLSSMQSGSKFSAQQGSVTATHKTGYQTAAQDLDALVEKRIQQIRESVAAMGTVEPTVVVGTNEFLEGNAEQFLDALEAEKQQRLEDFFIRFCHHIRDRYEELTPALLERLDDQKRLALSRLEALIEEPIAEAYARLGVPFDLRAAMAQLSAVHLMQPNRRRLNSFLRELPEHVAAAAIEISNQWYTPTQSVTIKGLGTTIPLVANPIPADFRNASNLADGSMSTTAVGSAMNAIAAQRGGGGGKGKGGGGGAATPVSPSGISPALAPMLINPIAVPATVGEWGRAPPERQAIFPSRPAPLPADPNREAHHRIHPQLLYVYECWRLTFEAVELHQVSQFNVHDLGVAATNANNSVVDYINKYVESLEEGIIAQKASIQEIEEAQHVMADAVAAGAGLLEQFHEALAMVEEATERDFSRAVVTAAELKIELS